MERCDFLKILSECRTLFVPNKYDASPRVITEAMTLNLNVLINSEIIGGWQYFESPGVFPFNIDDKNNINMILKISLLESNNRKWFFDYRKIQIRKVISFITELNNSIDSELFNINPF